jgi:O-methyltransferase
MHIPDLSLEVTMKNHIPRFKLQTRKKIASGLGYNSDGLAVWGKSVDFLNSARFLEAYRYGMNSGHKIMRDAGSDADIHIEWRVFVCCWAAYQARHLPGDFVECGVNTGILSLAICKYIDFNATGKNFFLFDTFCGIPENQMVRDEADHARQNNKEYYEECYEVTRRNFSPFPKATLVRGCVPDTLDTVKIDKVCYLSIDMNIVAPEIAALEFFWEKLSPGAPVILDDYGWLVHQNQKRAFDAFAAKKGLEILALPTGQGLLIKP